MAFPLPRGITPSEIEFLSEMELVTVVPRQRLEGLELLAVSVSNVPEIYPPQKIKLICIPPFVHNDCWETFH
jgi:GINS complex subunit 2